MNTIYIKVEVPDGYKATSIDCQSDVDEDVRIYEHQIAEIHLPTETEQLIMDEMDSDMEESGMAHGEIVSCLNHWKNKYIILRK